MHTTTQRERSAARSTPPPPPVPIFTFFIQTRTSSLVRLLVRRAAPSPLSPLRLCLSSALSLVSPGAPVWAFPLASLRRHRHALLKNKTKKRSFCATLALAPSRRRRRAE